MSLNPKCLSEPYLNSVLRKTLLRSVARSSSVRGARRSTRKRAQREQNSRFVSHKRLSECPAAVHRRSVLAVTSAAAHPLAASPLSPATHRQVHGRCADE